MSYEHIRPLLDNPRDVQRLHLLGERFARAEVPQSIVDAVRMGRITALRKPDGGVRGIVAGDLFRCLVSRTIAKQLAKEVEAATTPFQYALSTRAGCECVAHVIQGLCQQQQSRRLMVSVPTIPYQEGPCSKAFTTLTREAECCRL